MVCAWCGTLFWLRTDELSGPGLCPVCCWLQVLMDWARLGIDPVVRERLAESLRSLDGWLARTSPEQAMSIGFLIDQDTPMVWRGPMVTQALTQLLNDTRERVGRGRCRGICTQNELRGRPINT